jgi:uncharacterized membrane protein
MLLKPPVAERFSELYILGAGGKLWDYPRELLLGESATVTLGIGNYEGRETRYRIQVKAGGELAGEVGPVEIAPGDKWEEKITVQPLRTGLAQKVEALLFREGDSEPYRRAFFKVDVYGPEEPFTRFQVVSFPKELRVDEKATAILEVVNYEGQSVEYRVEAYIEGVKMSETSPFELKPGERREVVVTFHAWRRLDRQTAQFNLLRNGLDDPYKSMKIFNIHVLW